MSRRMVTYQQYQKMVYKMAWKYHWRTGIEWEDLYAQANLIFCEALQAWDPMGGRKFSAFLYHRLNQYLLNYVTIPHKVEPCINPDDNLMPSGQDVEAQVNLAIKVAKMSWQAQLVVQTVLHTPAELIDEVKKTGQKTFVINRTVLQKYFGKHMQWSQSFCERVFKEIGLALEAV